MCVELTQRSERFQVSFSFMLIFFLLVSRWNQDQDFEMSMVWSCGMFTSRTKSVRIVVIDCPICRFFWNIICPFVDNFQSTVFRDLRMAQCFQESTKGWLGGDIFVSRKKQFDWKFHLRFSASICGKDRSGNVKVEVDNKFVAAEIDWVERYRDPVLVLPRRRTLMDRFYVVVRRLMTLVVEKEEETSNRYNKA